MDRNELARIAAELLPDPVADRGFYAAMTTKGLVRWVANGSGRPGFYVLTPWGARAVERRRTIRRWFGLRHA